VAKEKVFIGRGFEYDPTDLAVAFNKVAKEMFGQDPFYGTKDRWWLPRNPLAFSTVKTGLNQEEKIAVGQMRIRGVDGAVALDGSTVQVLVVKSETAKIESFLDKIKANLKINSLYKGKAVTSSRGFMDLSKVNLDQLVYNDRVFQDLKDNLWVLIEKTDQCRRAGIRIRRKLLFQGRFGTGKTMAALVTAKKAIENGFTVFYLEPTNPDVSGSIEFMLQVAKKYPPALLLIEDFDREQRSGDFHAMGKTMAAIDGMISKDPEIIVVFTTNFKDKIAGGFQRPGRIDKTISFNAFTPQDTERLLKVVVPPEYLGSDINWQKVSGATSHMTPAFIGEGVGIGATLAAISRAINGEKPVVTEEILLQVSEGLQDQHKACEAAEQMGFSQSK
jgi:SpoVK/Ycf46/Vps4 family AAA+-type ATPase